MRYPGLHHPPHLVGRTIVGSFTAAVVLLSAGLGATPEAAAAPVEDAKLNAKIATIMKDSRVQRARSAAVVVDAATGSELYSRYATRATTPASNTKILTAVAAMDTLGPGYTFKTEVIRRGRVRKGVLNGNLYLKGYGDPTTLESDYRSLAKQVRAAGITRIAKKVVADASVFDSTRYNPNWSTGYASDYYAAQISALTVAPDTDYDSGTIIVTYRPGAKGKAANVLVTPAAAAKYVKISNRTVTGAKGTSDTFSVKRTLGTNTITVSGRVPLGRGASKEWVTVDRPDLYAATVFNAELAKVDVTVAGGTKAMTTPAGSRTRIGLDRSMTLSKLLVPFMKMSNNMHAETLTKAMGTKKGRAGNWSDGLSFTTAYMTSLGAPMTGIVLKDGSGLTRANKITPRAMGVMLTKVRKESWFPAFYASLPVAANSDRMTGGTLRNRMKGTAATNNAHAKTGSLTGVTALSGYVNGADGRLYVFSMLSEYSGTSPRPLEDKMVVAIAGHRR